MKQNMKKVIIGSTMLVLVLLLGVAGWLILGRRNAVQNVQEEINALGIEWYSEDEKEFTITTAEQLFEFARLSGYYDFAGQTIKLGADIVVSEGNAEDWANAVTYPEKAWESIYGFAGTFDGQGHTISGVYCIGYLYTATLFRSEQTDYVTAGLFRNTKPECVIKNFRLVNSFFDGDLNQGSGCISSYGGGTFDSIYIDAILTSQKNYIGGVIGRASEDTVVTNCWFDGVINVIGGYARPSGGIVGQATKDKKCVIEHCLMSGEMYNDLYERGVNMGGLIGGTSTGSVQITDCLVSGTLHNNWRIVGSAIGGISAEGVATLSHVYTVKEAWTQTVGTVSGTLNGTPVIYEKAKLQGLGGYQWTSLDFDNYWAAVEGGAPVLKTFAENPLSLDGVERMVDLTWYNDEQDTFVIENAADFYGLALLSYSHDFAGKTVKLGTDITINTGKASDWGKKAPAYDWTTIGSANLPFAGTFDGQKHTISGIYLNTDETYKGLFGMTTETAVIKNFSLKNSYFQSSAASIGSIAGRGVGTFDTIYSNAIVVSSNGNVGGMIGQVAGKTFDVKLKLSNCWFDGTVRTIENKTTCSKIGGMIGFVIGAPELTNCLNTGTIDASIYTVKNSETSKHVQPYVGGMIGQIHSKASAKLSYCFNAGDVKHSKEATTSYGSIIGTASGPATLMHVYATSESCERTANGYLTGQVMAYSEKKLSGYGGYEWTTLNFDKYWAVVLTDTPILKSFAKTVPSLNGIARRIDTSWYNEKENTFVLYDAADLYGFALLSYTNDFAGKTVKLGADITVNTGNAADWKTTEPESEWMSIGSLAKPFKGTFDGQMHTVSGIYLKTDTTYTGFFAMTVEEAVVKNFSLKNSYFESSAASLGSIAGRGIGTYDTIYSDAIVVSSNGNVGGMIGQVTGETVDMKLTMKNCWFDGSVTMTENKTTCSKSGGLLGFVIVKADISNCLNTGTIDASVYTVKNSETSKEVQPYVGGFIGQIHSKGSVTITGSMNAGTVKHSKEATTSYGSIIGTASGQKNGPKTLTISDTYTTTESCKRLVNGYVSGLPVSYKEARLVGYGGYKWTTLDFDKYWAVSLDDTPILKSFATTIPEINVARMIDTSWYDKNATTYTLYDAADLYGVAVLSGIENFKGKTIRLGDDIVINDGEAADWATTVPENEWDGIATTDYRFAGTFDGQMHSISGIYLNKDTKYAGLFIATEDTAVIKNLRVLNSYFYSTEEQLASIVGNAQGTIDTVYTDAIVESTASYIGGMVGATSSVVGVTMKNCWFDGTLRNNTTVANYYGGLIGRIHMTSTFTDCLNTGTVILTKSQYPNVGALIGLVRQEKGEASKITNSVNLGTMELHTNLKANYGAIVGRMSSDIIVDNCYTIKQSNISLVDASTAEEFATVTNSEVAGTIESVQGYGAFAGMANLFANKKDGIKFDSNWVAIKGKTPMLKVFADAADEKLTVDISWYKASDSEYEISNVAEFYGFAWLSNMEDMEGFEDKTIKLTDHITINEGTDTNEWAVIGQLSKNAFKGTFDGQGKEILGLRIDGKDADRGLFGYVGEGAEIKDFRLRNSYLRSTKNNLGSIVGTAKGGTFDSIFSDATVEGIGANNTSYNVGGFIGYVEGNVTIDNCWFNGSVTNNESASTGGLIGRSKATLVVISNCLNSGEISSTFNTPFLGGFVGYNQGGQTTVGMNYCLNTGLINTPNATGYRGLIVGSGSYSRKQVYSVSVEGIDVTNAATGTFAANEIYGTAAMEKMPQVFEPKSVDGKYVTYWGITATTPVLSSFVEYAPIVKDANNNTIPAIGIDTSWMSDAEGTESNPYLLADVGDFYGFALLSKKNTFANKHVKLTANISTGNTGNASTWATIPQPYEWIGIGDATSVFAGNFDGQGKEISGIYISSMSGVNQGFFRCVNTEGVIEDFRLRNSYIGGTATQTGSIAGLVTAGTFDSIFSDATVVSTTSDVGGLIGNATGTVTMNNCWFKGSVTNTQQVLGGLIGRVNAPDMTVTIKNCLNSGDVYTSKSHNYAFAGGLVGYRAGGTLRLENCLNTGAVSAPNAKSRITLTVGHGSGDAQYIYTVTRGNLTGSFAESEICGTDAMIKMPGLFAYNEDGNYKNYWAVTEKTPVLSSFAAYATDNNNNPISSVEVDTTWLVSGRGSQIIPYQIENTADFYGLAALSHTDNFSGKFIKLMGNIEVQNPGDSAEVWATEAPDYKWPGIGTTDIRFNGTFNGDNNTISGIYMNTATKYTGLFGGTDSGADIKNFSLKKSYFRSSQEQMGSIVGNAMGKFESIYSDAIVDCGGNYSAGMIGSTAYGGGVTIIDCWFDGTVKTIAAKSYLGGFIGYVQNVSTIENCLNTGSITNMNAGTPGIGGFVGYVKNVTNALTITRSLNMGELQYDTNRTGVTSYGLLVGAPANVAVISISDSYSTTQDGWNLVYNVADATYGGSGVVGVKSDINADNAETKMPNLFGLVTKWTIGTYGRPVLKTFKDVVPKH